MKKQIYILIFIIFTNLAFSQFEMPDIELKRGETAILPINNSNAVRDSNSYNFKLKFDLNMLDIIGVTVEPKDGFGFGYNYQIVYDQNGSFIEFEGASGGNGFGAEIEIEALAGPDSITYFTIDTLNCRPYEFDNIISTVSIPNPIGRTEATSISEPYPNPFNNRFVVDITLNSNTNVEAKMFNAGAKLVAIEDNIKGVDISLNNDSGTKVEFGEVEAGTYQIVVNVDPVLFSNGYYYLGISINNEVTYKPILMTN